MKVSEYIDLLLGPMVYYNENEAFEWIKSELISIRPWENRGTSK